MGSGSVLLLFNAGGRANSTGMSEPDRVYAWPESGGDGDDARSCKLGFGESHDDVRCIGCTCIDVGVCANSGVRAACGCVEARRGK